MSFPTWSDLNDDSLIPPLGKHSLHDLGPIAIMVSTAPDFKYIEANSGKKTLLPSLFTGNLFTLNEGRVAVAGPYIGSPSAAMVLESLIARGVSKVVVVGWCGSISDQLQIGDLLMADSAICDEGTSRNYMQMPPEIDFPTVFPTPLFSSDLKTILQSGQYDIQCKYGRIWTTDAIYRETSKKVTFFREMGAVAVEMECSALFAVAKYRKVEIAALLIVSDDLSSSEWIPGFKTKEFKESRKKLLTSITAAVGDLPCSCFMVNT